MEEVTMDPMACPKLAVDATTLPPEGRDAVGVTTENTGGPGGGGCKIRQGNTNLESIDQIVADANFPISTVETHCHAHATFAQS